MPEAGGWTFLDRGQLDLSQPEMVIKALREQDFDVLINAAAYTAVDAAEDDEATAFAVNAHAVAAMAALCRDRGALLIHVGTDYVFDGLANTPLSENEPTAPIGVYGRSKLAGEEAIRAALKRHIILRTSWLYGPEGHNFLRTMLRLGAQRSQLNVVFDQVGTPTYVRDLAGAIVHIAKAYEAAPEQCPFGTYHYGNEGVASWYDFAHAIFAESGNKIHIAPVRSDAFPTKARRPAYSVLDKHRIKTTFDLPIRHWREALAACLSEMKSP